METESHPIAGVDYPRTFQEMEQWFRDEAACRDYIRRLRWPEGFICPHCGVSGEPWLMSDELLRCCSCRARTSFTAGTIFEGTRKPLRTWFMAMWFVTSQKNGVSALGLQRVLGLGSYETAWTWLHKLRRAMVRPGRERLSGTVEVDETYVGGPEKDKWGREVESKAIIAIGAEEDGKGVAGAIVPSPRRAGRSSSSGALPHHHWKTRKSERFRRGGSLKGISNSTEIIEVSPRQQREHHRKADAIRSKHIVLQGRARPAWRAISWSRQVKPEGAEQCQQYCVPSQERRRVRRHSRFCLFDLLMMQCREIRYGVDPRGIE